MTDNQWTSPGIEGRPPALPEPAAPGYTADPGPAVGPGGAQPGWTPPPKPGLIPLRPLDLGTILGASFRVLRRNPRPTFGAALLLQGSVSLLLFLVVAGATFGAVSHIGSSTTENAAQIMAGSSGLIILAGIVPALLTVAASAILQGIIVLEVSRGAVGERSTLRALWNRARGRIGALIGWAALVLLALSLVFGALAVIVVLLAVTFGTGGLIGAVLLGFFGLLGLGALSIWLSTKLAFVPSALVIERLSIRNAVARSWWLTESYFWRTLGISALVAVILGVVTQVVGLPLNVVSQFATVLIDPQGQNGSGAIVLVVVLAVLFVVILVVFQSVTSVVQSATTALLYLDLRIRKEGLDLELARYVEAKQSGDQNVVDPLLHDLPMARPPAVHDPPWG